MSAHPAQPVILSKEGVDDRAGIVVRTGRTIKAVSFDKDGAQSVIEASSDGKSTGGWKWRPAPLSARNEGRADRAKAKIAADRKTSKKPAKSTVQKK